MIRYQIRSEYGLGSPELFAGAADEQDDPEALLEAVAMAGLAGLLRQLGDLAEFAAEMFHDLHEEVVATACRGHELKLRVQQLEADFPSLENALIQQMADASFPCDEGTSWNANVQIDENIVTRGDMPRFVLDSYEECRGPPRLFMLDKFDTAGAGACLKRYSDPSYFKNYIASSSCTDIIVAVEKRSHKIKKKGFRWKRGETLESLLAANSYSQNLPAERLNKKIPPRTTKLKHGYLKDLDRNMREYCKNQLLDVISTQNKIISDYSAQQLAVEERYNSSDSVSSESGDNTNSLKNPSKTELAKVVPINESDSHRTMDIVLSTGQTDELQEKCTKAIPVEQNGLTADTETAWQVNKCEERNDLFVPASFSSTLRTSGNQLVNDRSAIGYRSGEISSDQDNFVDASNIIESESGSEPETDSKAKFISDLNIIETSGRNRGNTCSVVRNESRGADYNTQSLPIDNTEGEVNCGNSHYPLLPGITEPTTVGSGFSDSSVEERSDDLGNNYNSDDDLMDVSSSSSLFSARNFYSEVSNSSNANGELLYQPFHETSIESSIEGSLTADPITVLSSYNSQSEIGQTLSSDGLPKTRMDHKTTPNSVEHGDDYSGGDNIEIAGKPADPNLENRTQNDENAANSYISERDDEEFRQNYATIPVAPLIPEYSDACQFIDEEKISVASLCADYTSWSPKSVQDYLLNDNELDEGISNRMVMFKLGTSDLMQLEDNQVKLVDAAVADIDDDCSSSTNLEEHHYNGVFDDTKAMDVEDVSDNNNFSLQDTRTIMEHSKGSFTTEDMTSFIPLDEGWKENGLPVAGGTKLSEVGIQLYEKTEKELSYMPKYPSENPEFPKHTEETSSPCAEGVSLDENGLGETSATSDVRKDEMEAFRKEILLPSRFIHPPIKKALADFTDATVEFDKLDGYADNLDGGLLSKVGNHTSEISLPHDEPSETVELRDAEGLKSNEFASSNVVLPDESLDLKGSSQEKEIHDCDNVQVSPAENAPGHNVTDNHLSLCSGAKFTLQEPQRESLASMGTFYNSNLETADLVTTSQDKAAFNKLLWRSLAPNFPEKDQLAASSVDPAGSLDSFDDSESQVEEPKEPSDTSEISGQPDLENADLVDPQNASPTRLQPEMPYWTSYQEAQPGVSTDVSQDNFDASDSENDVLEGCNDTHLFSYCSNSGCYDQDDDFRAERFGQYEPYSDNEAVSLGSGWEPATPPNEENILPGATAETNVAPSCEKNRDNVNSTVAAEEFILEENVDNCYEDKFSPKQDCKQDFSHVSSVEVQKLPPMTPDVKPVQDSTALDQPVNDLVESPNAVISPEETLLPSTKISSDKQPSHEISQLPPANAASVNTIHNASGSSGSQFLLCSSELDLPNGDEIMSTESGKSFEGVSEASMRLPEEMLPSISTVELEKPPPLPPIQWRLGKPKSDLSQLNIPSSMHMDERIIVSGKTGRSSTNECTLPMVDKQSTDDLLEDVSICDFPPEAEQKVTDIFSTLPLNKGVAENEYITVAPHCSGSGDPVGLSIAGTENLKGENKSDNHDESDVDSLHSIEPFAPTIFNDIESSATPPVELNQIAITDHIEDKNTVDQHDESDVSVNFHGIDVGVSPPTELKQIAHISEEETSEDLLVSSTVREDAISEDLLASSPRRNGENCESPQIADQLLHVLKDGGTESNDICNDPPSMVEKAIQVSEERSTADTENNHQHAVQPSEDENPKEQLTNPEHKQGSKHEAVSLASSIAQSSNQIVVFSAPKDDRDNYAGGVIDGGLIQIAQPSLIGWTAGNQMLYPGCILSLEDLLGKVTGNEDSIRKTYYLHNMPRNPLVEEVAAHDRSTMRKVAELFPALDEPKQEKRNMLLEQIRNKCFNLKPVTAAKPSIKPPTTNLKVAAIVEKATAIRQAFMGSDGEDDDDSWSDS